jgi:phosphatidate cytidylyltransferase
MLRWRLLLGALFVAALVIWCWLDAVVGRPGAFLLPLALMITWLGVVELLDLFNKKGRYPLAWAVFAGALFTVFLSGALVFFPNGIRGGTIGPTDAIALGLAASLLLAFYGEMRRFGGHWQTTLNLGLSMLAILYIGGLMAFIVALRAIGVGPGGDDGRSGMLALVSLIAIVKMSDTGQYTAGRLFGRHKLAPRVSPGKTWEGVAGGMVFAIVAALIVFGWAAHYIAGTSSDFATSLAEMGGTLRITIYAIFVAAAGILGDLAESLLKRDADVKDSSTWLPGFGGVLDLLDSLLGAAPVAYLFWATGVISR